MSDSQLSPDGNSPDQRAAPRPPFRVGVGDDTHRLDEGGPLRIGGIDVPGSLHAIGHSDADALLHAVTDALLGALAQPDIGRIFPDTAAENAGRDSVDFLHEAHRRVLAAGYAIGNLDAVILAQAPKLAPHIDTIRHRLAKMLSVDVAVIGLKAKTGERVDAVGRGEAISARAVVLVYRDGVYQDA